LLGYPTPIATAHSICYLQERSDGRGVVFATGTPISNTLAEMYTMLRYLAPEMLAERKVEHFDSWAANFAESVTSLELAPDGSGYRMHTLFAKFINLPELLSVFRTVADVQTADMLNLPRPDLENGKPAVASAPASPELKAFVRTLTERAERLKKERVDPSVDNMLKITGEGRKAALDMRLVDPSARPEQETKIDLAVSRIIRIWTSTQNERSTQLVFSDLSTPDPERFNVYDDVRSKLIKAGISPITRSRLSTTPRLIPPRSCSSIRSTRGGFGCCSDRLTRWAQAQTFRRGS